MMDQIDAKILQLLSMDANATTSSLKKDVALSIPAINKRVKNLKKKGIIKKSTIVTDGTKVGKPILAFVMIIIKSLDKVDKLMEYVNSNPDILECFSVSGEYDYILKVVAKDVETLDQKLLELKKQNNITKSHTLFALSPHKQSYTILP
ncbi:MAG: Lrp/AsnC family transcriptional regulator [Clostridia bacterium]|nr:Lrp/AsnC family transcriptional regulator [Clostridia bacterium]MBQ3596262.1 Lrp/AsnC family transcriptional regulator [Clostridia bacterium]